MALLLSLLAYRVILDRKKYSTREMNRWREHVRS